jgi:hypothetical protein
MKKLSDLLNHQDPELVEFAECFEQVMYYSDLHKVKLNKLTLGQVARALMIDVQSNEFKGLTTYYIDVEVKGKEVRFWCLAPKIKP